MPEIDFTQIETWFTAETLPFIIGGVLLLVLLFLYLAHRMRVMHLKAMIKRNRKASIKKYNVSALLEKIDNKRKPESNDFKGLKGKAKKLVKQYLKHKHNEIKYIAIFKTRGRFKFKLKACVIKITQEKQDRVKKETYQSLRDYIKLANKYDCLDQFMVYLDELPQYMMDDGQFEYYLDTHDVTISYQYQS